MNKTEYYYFTIPRTAKLRRDWEIISERIEEYNGSFQYLYLQGVRQESARKVTLCFIYLTKANRQHEPIEDEVAELSDLFETKIELLPLRQRTAPKEVWQALSTAKRLSNYSARSKSHGEAEARLIISTPAELERQVQEMMGFRDFKAAYQKLSVFIDRMASLGRRGNYNIVLVNDCNANEFLFIDILYSLYASKGIVTDQRIFRGDLDDAVRSSFNSNLFYFLTERWEFGASGCVQWGMAQEESFRLLSRRKHIYVTTMDRPQYEKALERDSFRALFPNAVEVKDLDKGEKLELLRREAREYNFGFDAASFKNSDVLKLPYPVLQTQMISVIQRQLSDVDNNEFVMRASDFDPLLLKHRQKSDAMEELERLIGLTSVKQCVREIVALLRNRGRAALPCLHMVFRGNPGTGKTTVARLIGRIFGELGVIKDGEKFVETDRDGLVSRYLGGTAAKTAAVVKDAIGGVLFIDEAYALTASADYDYGQEAINTLVKRLEDYRKDFVCIMAGYTDEMERMLDSNPGLRDRIQFYIDFPDYDAHELLQIYRKYAETENYVIDRAAEQALQVFFEETVSGKDQNFSNARLVRKFFERTRIKQALRGTDNTITNEDVQSALAESDIRSMIKKSGKRSIGFTS